MNDKIESGLQLFARTIDRPNLEGLNADMFPFGGPHPSQLIEITGNEGTGKTILITDVIARCIMPKSYAEYPLPGKNCAAVIINTSHHFSLFKLSEIIEYYLKTLCRKIKPGVIKTIIEKSLENLTVLNCYGFDNFQITLYNLESLILNRKDVSVVAVDSISAFYWTERALSDASIVAHHSAITSLLEDLANKFGVIVFYTKVYSTKEPLKRCEDIRFTLKRSGSEGLQMDIVHHSMEKSLCLKYAIGKTVVFVKE